MALSTTCPQCRTRFRVTPAQLQQRAGRVRCGICRHAFDALEELDELDDAPDDADGASPSFASRSDATPRATARVDTRGVDDEPFGGGPDTDVLPPTGDGDAGTARPGGDMAADLPGELPDAFRKLLDAWPSELDWSDARTPAAPSESPVVEAASGDLARKEPAREGITAEDVATEGTSARSPLPDTGPDTVTPSVPMLRQPSADAGASHTESVPSRDADLPRFGVPAPTDGPAAPPWRRPVLMLAVALLVLVALLQAALLGRHALAAREPALRPALQALAGAAGLRVELPRRLSQLTLEGFDLQATGPAGRLALTAVLRNRGGMPVQWPALELTLTDEGGGVVVRRALLPVEYLRGSGAKLDDGMPARSELPVRMLLDAPLTRSAGYAVDLFYP